MPVQTDDPQTATTDALAPYMNIVRQSANQKTADWLSVTATATLGDDMKALDLFCGAGGAAMGLHRAGFEVVGVDIIHQPNYPFEFHQADALNVDLSGFDFIWASPPCQAYTALRSLQGDREYVNHIPETRELLIQSGLPYVIENVVGAPLNNPLLLCGSMFGLGVRRHRIFETKPAIYMRSPCSCRGMKPLDVTGTGGPGGRSRKPHNMKEAGDAMGIDWMTRREITQAIPPAYSEYLGRQVANMKEGR